MPIAYADPVGGRCVRKNCSRVVNGVRNPGKCYEPNPWLIYLKKMRGRRLTQQQLKDGYAAWFAERFATNIQPDNYVPIERIKLDKGYRQLRRQDMCLFELGAECPAVIEATAQLVRAAVNNAALRAVADQANHSGLAAFVRASVPDGAMPQPAQLDIGDYIPAANNVFDPPAGFDPVDLDILNMDLDDLDDLDILNINILNGGVNMNDLDAAAAAAAAADAANAGGGAANAGGGAANAGGGAANAGGGASNAGGGASGRNSRAPSFDGGDGLDDDVDFGDLLHAKPVRRTGRPFKRPVKRTQPLKRQTHKHPRANR